MSDDGQIDNMMISIHAPPRGATARRWRTFPQSARFQFTPLREGRPPQNVLQVAGLAISIHAPPRGATPFRGREVLFRRISIHAPPRGATGVSFSCLLWLSISIHAPPRGATNVSRSASPAALPFQFTPLREGRPYVGIVHPPLGGNFNSRPSARGDARSARSCILH